MTSSRWRVALYELLTQAILLLGWLRSRLMRYQPSRRPRGRVFDVHNDERWECCDCGLAHDQVIEGPGFECEHERRQAKALGIEVVGHSYPVRPLGYGYRLRALAGVPSLASAKRVERKGGP